MEQLEQILHSFQNTFARQVNQTLAQHLPPPPVTSNSSSSSHPSSVPSHLPSGSVSLPAKVKISTPSNFTGTRTVNAEAWLFEMNQYLTVCNVSDEQRVAVASSYLKESALQWWLNQNRSLANERPRDWLSFAAAFRERFQPIAASQTARAQLRALRQGTMSVAEYCNKFYTLVNLISDMGEADQVANFLSGLSQTVATPVCLYNPQTLQTAMAAAQRVEVLLGNRNPYSSSSPSTSSTRIPSYTHTPVSAPSSTSTSSAPMELGNVNFNMDSLGQELDEVEQEYQKYLDEGDAGFEPNPEIWNAKELVKEETKEEETEQLQVIQRDSRRGGSRNSAPYLSREEFTRCMKNGLCLRCKKPGHSLLRSYAQVLCSLRFQSDGVSTSDRLSLRGTKSPDDWSIAFSLGLPSEESSRGTLDNQTHFQLSKSEL